MINAENRGIALNVYRWTLGDCTNDGITKRNDRLTLVGFVDERVNRSIYKPDPMPVPEGARHRDAEGDNAVILRVRKMGGETIGHLVPAVVVDGAYVPEPRWCMAGGAFADGDARVGDLTEALGLGRFRGPLAVHDRIEHKG